MAANKATISAKGQAFDRFDVLGIPIAEVDLNSASGIIQIWAADPIGRYICVRDVHGVMLANKDSDFFAIHQAAAMVTPDGMPLVAIGKWRGKKVDRVCGADLMEKLISDGVGCGLRHYFYGGAKGVAEQLARKMMLRHPGMKIAGIESPPFGEISDKAHQATMFKIQQSNADIVWVGLSTPKQERWMFAHHQNCGATMIGVGAAFDFHAGTVKRAPKWMQKSGLEWLHRLTAQPKRLWRRYLILAPQFVFKVAWQGIRKRRVS